MKKNELPFELKNLPTNPGVYKYYQKENLIYVGKAKNIRKRVTSYFNKTNSHSPKTRKLIQEITQIDFVIVDSEIDALLLENNLIKENQPKYNILLKDGKSFPYICITKEPFPKIYSTRRYRSEKGDFYGPYTNVKTVNNVLELIQNLYNIRNCNLLLSATNIKKGKFGVCLEYHINNCKGPCEGHQTEDNYLRDIESARNVIKGHLKIVKAHFTNEMIQSAKNLNFEKAQLIKNKIDILNQFKSRTVIVNNKLPALDVITINSTKNTAFINYMRVDQGIINISESSTIKKKLDECDSQILEQTILTFRERFESTSNLILTNQSFELWKEEIKVICPQIGDKKKLVELSLKNVLFHKKEDINKREAQKTKKNHMVIQLQEDLKLNSLPNHIECFDNSNIQGSNPVASMVCFKYGKPSKKDYRHFKIKTVIGPDDFGSMREVVFRRYKHLKEAKLPYPNLIVVDGGKGQLSAASDALKELNLYQSMAIIGIAKKFEEIYYPEDSIPIHINKKSASLRLIQHLRDEAHRFAITFHRSLRSKNQIQSKLDNIQGIGPKTKSILLTRYKSISKIKVADLDALSALIGRKKAKLIIYATNKKGG